MVALRRRHLDKGRVQLRLDLSSDACICQVDRIAIEQVVSNLLRNASDALLEKADDRVLTVHTQKAPDSQPGKGFMRLTVSDNGPGLQGRTLDTLCATFYSTKREGMGLGLGICRAIIESHGGVMSARETAGGGATFEFTLPLLPISHSKE